MTPPTPSVDELIQQIHDVRFTPVRLREGYDMGEVDLFLDDLEQLVRLSRPVDPLIDAARFTPVRLREGYDMADVDRFLDTVQAASAALLRGAPAPESGAATPAATPAPAVPTSTTSPTSSSASVIEERPGLFGKLFGRKS